MKRSLLWLLGLLGTLVLIWLGATAYVGYLLEDHYRQQLRLQAERFDFLGIEVRHGLYERGVFGSRAETVYVDAESGRTLCRLRHDLRHGPLFPSRRLIGLAAIDSRLILPAGLRREHLVLEGADHPLKAESFMALDGFFISRIKAPAAAWRADGGRLAWSPLHGRIELKQGLRQKLSMDFELSRLKGRTENQSEGFAFEGMKLTAWNDQDPAGMNGTQELTLDIHRAELLGDASARAAMESFSLTGQGSWSGGIMNSTTAVRLGSLKSSGIAVQQGALDLRTENVDRTALQELQALQNAPEGAAQGRGTERAAIRRVVKEILQAAPSLEISRLQFRTGNGTVRFQGMVAYRPVGSVPLGDTAELIRQCEAQAEIAVPRKLALKAVSIALSLFKSFRLEGDRQSDGRDGHGSAAKQARQWLGALRAMGLIDEEDGRYATSAGLQAGVLSVNGVRLMDLATMQE